MAGTGCLAACSFPYRGDEVAAQAATGAIRYDISLDPAAGRWYLDASWKTSPAPAASLGELRRHRVIAVDVNAGHLAAAVVTPDGNVTGTPFTVPLDLAGLPAATRDGRLRTAITSLIATARRHGARAIVIEDLDFAGARAEGRERHASRPARGRRGGAGDRQTCARPPGAATGRHDRRQPEDQPPESCPPSARRPVCNQGRRNPPGPAAAPKAEDRAGQPDHPPDQAAQDRSGPPDSRDYLLLSH